MENRASVAMATTLVNAAERAPLKRHSTDSNVQPRPQPLKKTKRVRRGELNLNDRRKPVASSPAVPYPSGLAFPRLSASLPPVLPSLPPPLWTTPQPAYSWTSMSPLQHNHMLFNHYLQGFQYPGFQGGSWASSSTLPALSPLPPRHEGADSAPAEPAAKAEMPRVDSSTHINSLVAQYSLAQAGAAAAAAACAGHPLSPAQLVSPRAGWPHFAAYPPVMGPMGPMGPIACVPGSDAILSPKPAAGRSASTDGSPSPSTGLPSLLESPLQSEVTLPAESDGESFCKVEFLAERVDGEVKVEPPEGAESAEQDWRVTKGTRRAMQLWLEGGAEGDVKGMGPFDWLDEPSGAEEATGLPHWVLAELGEGGAGKKSGEAVEEEVYRVLFRADSMESATGEEVRSETRENEKLMNDASPKSPLQSHDSCRQQFGDESPAMGMNTTAAEAPVEGGHVLNRVSQTGCAFSTSVKIGPSSGTGPNDEPIAQAPEDNTNEDIWRDVSALSDLLAASSSPILDSELCLELQAGGDWQF